MEDIKTVGGFAVSKTERKQVEIEESLETLSRYLDGFFKIPGTGWRFGFDALIGLIPNFGDIATSLVSFYIIVAGVRYGVPKITILRMAFNVGLDYVAGMVPFFGDMFDFVWKSNKRNMALIRERGTGLGNGTKSDWIFVGVILGSLVGVLAISVIASFTIFWIAVRYLSSVPAL